jgi:hypothetical protein
MPTIKRLLPGAGAILLAILFPGCATYKVPSGAYGPKPGAPYYEVRHKAAESPIYNYVPRKREQLRPLDLRWISWCFVGNEDDGIFGEYAGKAPYSTNINFGTYCSWSILRNPMHNWDFYVIGSADWKRHYDYSVLSLGGEKLARTWSNSAKWDPHKQPFFDIGFNDFKPYFKLDPWISDFYLGWRRNGSFEIKVRAELSKAKKKPSKPATALLSRCEAVGCRAGPNGQ